MKPIRSKSQEQSMGQAPLGDFKISGKVWADRYQLIEVLGSGGMGTVWRAKDMSLGLIVALKILAGPVSAKSRESFEWERVALGRLSHPNVVSVLGGGEYQGIPYLTMEFIDGSSPKGPLPAAEALRIAREAAWGLDHIHRRGLLHRDLKPANLLIEKNTFRVVLVDLGISWAHDSPSLDTTRGSVMGTAPYIPPESWRGKRFTPQSDLFALGVILYEIATGENPFRGENLFHTAMKIAEENPSYEGLAPLLAQLCRWCLHKDPRQRCPNARELALAIERQQLTVVAPPRPWQRRLQLLGEKLLGWRRPGRKLIDYFEEIRFQLAPARPPGPHTPPVECAGRCGSLLSAQDVQDHRVVQTADGRRYCFHCVARGKGAFKLIGDYWLVKEGGKDSWGEIWEGIQRSTERLVALKLMDRQCTPLSQRMRLRINRGLCRQARLSRCPQIVAVYEVGHDTVCGVTYYALEYIKGHSLRKLIKEKKRLSWEEAVYIMWELAQALSYLRRRAVVHRNIKPGVIFIDYEGRVRLSDFSQSRHVSWDEEADLAYMTVRQPTLTQAGRMVGTPEYASPEQFEDARAVDHRSDLWSLGVVSHEMLTGKRLFKINTKNQRERLKKVKQLIEEYTPSPIPGIPKKLNKIIARLLTPDRNRRYSRADAVLKDLRKLLRTQGKGE